MSLIDSTYFSGEINLPGGSLSGDLADIDDYITRYEKEALIDILGYTLYKDFIANPSDTRWTRFSAGYEYSIDYLGESHLVKWNGLVNTEKVSLLAFYIYYKYVEFHVTHTSGFGELLQKAENADKISVSQKRVNAWNRFIELRGIPGEAEINPTCYNFLDKFEDDATNGYDKWLFLVLPRTNAFGI